MIFLLLYMYGREITLLASELTLSYEHHMRLKESEHLEAVKRSSLMYTTQLESGNNTIYLFVYLFILLLCNCSFSYLSISLISFKSNIDEYINSCMNL